MQLDLVYCLILKKMTAMRDSNLILRFFIYILHFLAPQAPPVGSYTIQTEGSNTCSAVFDKADRFSLNGRY